MQGSSRGVASAGLAAMILWRTRRFPGESAGSLGIPGGSPEHTIPWFSVIPSAYSNSDRAMAGGGQSRRRSGRKVFGAMWPPGV